MNYTEHSYLSEEELLTAVDNNANATGMEKELASRLDDALDYIDTLEQALEANGIELYVVESFMQ